MYCLFYPWALDSVPSVSRFSVNTKKEQSQPFHLFLPFWNLILNLVCCQRMVWFEVFTSMLPFSNLKYICSMKKFKVVALGCYKSALGCSESFISSRSWLVGNWDKSLLSSTPSVQKSMLSEQIGFFQKYSSY